jgi:hypothetical protein
MALLASLVSLISTVDNCFTHSPDVRLASASKLSLPVSLSILFCAPTKFTVDVPSLISITLGLATTFLNVNKYPSFIGFFSM